MALPSLLIARFLFLLVLFGFANHGAFAQDSLTDIPVLFSQIVNTLDALGYSQFATVARQVAADPNETAFPQALCDTSGNPRTLFVPNDDAFVSQGNRNGYIYDAGDTTFLSAMLLYHLIPGSWTLENVTSSSNFITPTSLQGHNVTALENGRSQVMVSSRGANSSLVVLNEPQTPVVVDTLGFPSLFNLTVHVVTQIIGFPGSYSFLTETLQLKQIETLRTAANAPSLDTVQGYTLFVPVDAGFIHAETMLSSLDPINVWNNHIIMGQTLYSSDLAAGTYSSTTGLTYSIDLADLQITLNGVTARIINTDVLTDNGVIHIIDSVLWNSTGATNLAVSTGPGSSSLQPLSLTPSSTLTVSPSATPSVNGMANMSSGTGAVATNTASSSPTAAVGAARGSPLSPGAIIGIVALGLVAICAPLILIFIWRYRRSQQGIRVRRNRRPRASVFTGPPTPVPFTTWYDTSALPGEESYPLKETSRHGSQAGSLSSQPPARASREKANDHFALRDNNTRPPDLAAVQPPAPGVPMPVLTAEVVDHIVHQVSQRIDRAPPFPPGIPNGPPPGYPPSYHSSPPISRSRLRRTMG